MAEVKKISALVSCYKGEKYLADFLRNVAQQTIADQLEIILVHNDPSQAELATVRQFTTENPCLVNHVIVPREKLAVSTNRAMKASNGEYLCIWNIDDLRTPDSLELMVKTLDAHPRAGFTYGDYIIVNSWLKQTGRLITEPEFEKKEFVQSMHLGPFYMWRKKLCNKIGYWDEQCLQGADFEYAVRLAVEVDGVKTGGLLGYYLDEGLGLSTKRATLQPIERTFVELRYGVYHKLDFLYTSRAQKYRLYEVLDGDRWVSIDSLAPHRKNFTESKWLMVIAVVRYPFWLAQRVINKLKRKML